MTTDTSSLLEKEHEAYKLIQTYLQRKKSFKNIINRDPIEKRYQKLLYDFSKKQGRVISRMVRDRRYRRRFSDLDTDDDLDYNINEYLIPIERYSTEERLDLMNKLGLMGGAVFVGAMLHTGNNYKKAGVKAPLGLNDPTFKLNNLVESYTFPAAEKTVRNYHNEIENIIRDGFREKKGQRQISDDIRRYMESKGERKPDYIYDRIARNETTRFTNEGKMEMWKAAGVKEYDWIVGPGPCNEVLICEQMGAGAPYRVGHGPLPIEDTHINCLCEIDAPDYPEMTDDGSEDPGWNDLLLPLTIFAGLLGRELHSEDPEYDIDGMI